MSEHDLPAVPPPSRPPITAARDTAVERLTAAYADGHLSHEELDERLGLVLATTSHDAVVAAVADLPVPAAERALEIDAINGRIERRGAWRVPRRIRITSEYGRVRLDLSRAVLESPVVDIELELTYGRARIVVPPGAVVDIDGLRTDWKQPRYDGPRGAGGGPTIRITGHMEYGRLTVKHARRR